MYIKIIFHLYIDTSNRYIYHQNDFIFRDKCYFEGIRISKFINNGYGVGYRCMDLFTFSFNSMIMLTDSLLKSHRRPVHRFQLYCAIQRFPS